MGPLPQPRPGQPPERPPAAPTSGPRRPNRRTCQNLLMIRSQMNSESPKPIATGDRIGRRLGKQGDQRETRGMSTGPVQLTAELAAEWRERAACSGYRHTLFFPVGDTDAGTVDRALEICMGCAVIDDCLEYALETNQRAGIWGGTTEDERRSLRRKWLATRRRVGDSLRA
jgi:WhiB family transcriptional regulator, redox-sensing transcriptional regulator